MTYGDQIECPECGYIFEQEATYRHVTYYGDEGPTRDQCDNCETELIIDECVTRNFEVVVRGPKHKG